MKRRRNLQDELKDLDKWPTVRTLLGKNGYGRTLPCRCHATVKEKWNIPCLMWIRESRQEAGFIMWKWFRHECLIYLMATNKSEFWSHSNVVLSIWGKLKILSSGPLFLKKITFVTLFFHYYCPQPLHDKLIFIKFLLFSFGLLQYLIEILFSFIFYVVILSFVLLVCQKKKLKGMCLNHCYKTYGA